MQIIVAAAHKRPIRPAPAEAFRDGCPALLERVHDDMAPERRAVRRAARSQCRTLARARHAAQLTLSGAELETVLRNLDAMETTGIPFANDFQPRLDLRQAMNMTRRAQGILGDRALAAIADELAGLSVAPERVHLSLPASNLEFRASVERTLDGIDAGSTRYLLCRPLGNARLQAPPCPGVPADPVRADVVLARMNLDTGGITRRYESHRLAWDARISGGSVWKLAIAVAALHQGFTADSLLCPRSASTGTGANARPLRRTTAPVFGYERCTQSQRVTLADAMARSDSLAFLDLARQLGDAQLRAVLQALGVRPDDGVPLSYGLAYGTQSVDSTELLRLGQAVFALADGVEPRSAGPRLVMDRAAPPLHAQALARLLPLARQRQALAEVLAAPVARTGGTLHALGGALYAGKTGTTSSTVRPGPEERPYIASRLVLGYDPARREVVLATFVGPGQQPLARSNLGLDAVQPVLALLLG